MMNEISHGCGMGLVWIIGLILLAVIGWLIYKVVIQKNNLILSNKRSPLEILKKRYAKGKIGKKEFDQKRNDIL